MNPRLNTPVSGHSLFATVAPPPSQLPPDPPIATGFMTGTLQGAAFGDLDPHNFAIADSAFGTVGGVGGDGIFVPMLTLVVGFDAKSAAALSKYDNGGIGIIVLVQSKSTASMHGSTNSRL
ncbi:hypothetical protein L2E82_12161 [Cichorium intybus]|uniref:Uncharacterized protein n=1 Tax=Cichorium intybus TaxID=13427 RepID=A0ACB9GG16_CICIN|nr:hypothetical protein L2E82_12161 [Cichorium intybus]